MRYVNTWMRNIIYTSKSQSLQGLLTKVSLIDHVYVSDPDHILTSSVLQYSISDHFPTLTTLRLRAPHKSDGGTIRYRCTKIFDENDIITDL